MTIISEFLGEGKFVEREACVRRIDNLLMVELYDKHGLYKIHRLTEGTIQKAEDLAENWLMGETN